MTFEEMAARRDPLYGIKPDGETAEAINLDELAQRHRDGDDYYMAYITEKMRDAALLPLTIRALRNETL